MIPEPLIPEKFRLRTLYKVEKNPSIGGSSILFFYSGSKLQIDFIYRNFEVVKDVEISSRTAITRFLEAVEVKEFPIKDLLEYSSSRVIRAWVKEKIKIEKFSQNCKQGILYRVIDLSGAGPYLRRIAGQF